MTTELGNSDASRAAERRGLSRRQMIKASAVAGAAAWTAPVIVDSLASPAAAVSGCKPYWMKLTAGGGCNSNCFGAGSGVSFPLGGNPVGSGSSPVGAKWGGSCGYPGPCGNGDAGDGDSRMPSSVTEVTIGSGMSAVTYYKVVFNSNGCTYSNATAWQIGGRYEPNDPGDQFKKVTTSCASSAGPTGGVDGCYWTATNTAWIRKYFSGNSGNSLNYIYNLICCTS
jgi:hypothetical protein